MIVGDGLGGAPPQALHVAEALMAGRGAPAVLEFLEGLQGLSEGATGALEIGPALGQPSQAHPGPGLALVVGETGEGPQGQLEATSGLAQIAPHLVNGRADLRDDPGITARGHHQIRLVADAAASVMTIARHPRHVMHQRVTRAGEAVE